MPTNREVAKSGNPEGTLSIEALISQAITNGTPVETMEKLLSMRRELKAEFAKEEFDKAMASFQEECPIIEKRKKVKNATGTELYSYAPLEDIVEQVKPFLSAWGFSYSFDTESTEKGLVCLCVVKHRSGHTERTSMPIVDATKTGLMSNNQAAASTFTFTKRYAFCNAFGILTGDEDNDAPKPDEFSEETVDKAVAALNAAPDLDSLKRFYASLGKLKLVKKVVEAKDKRKDELK
jgi:hypothetical protein